MATTRTTTTATPVQRPGDTHDLPGAETCWDAVLRRDRAYDGVFVYAVRTTGVYCRPSCPSKRPKRENVAFFTREDAEAAGYRPCRRCRPRVAVGTLTDQAVREAMAYLEDHMDEQVTLDRLAAEVGVSPFHLQRTFTERVGVSPRSYQVARRLERFRERARAGDSVSRATYEAGFNSSRSLYEQAEARLGMTPGTYSRGGKGLRIRFTIVDSDLGRVLVGATEKGVCAVSLGEDDRRLEAGLATEFPNAELHRDDESLREWAAVVAQKIAGRDPGPAVPLDLRGTVFQMRVWNALREIPLGETRSYREIAEKIGAPRASRAVARACAMNHAAIVVPCHRVVRSDGDTGGYRWGAERKQRLLAVERRRSPFTDSAVKA